MSDFLDRIGKLSPKRLALLALELHEQVEASRRRGNEPIAIVGMGCRLPGDTQDPRAFWELLRSGRDAIREVPRERWDIDAFFDPDPDVPGRIAVRTGGFLDDVSGFDATFFGISPREALTMDPQQRLLLEVAWEALEDAALSPERLSGSPTGVFVGVCNADHFQRVLQRGDEDIDMYVASGNALSVTAGRISYCLGLQGPALAVDTACSSSLVALHLACQSLRSGDSKVALAAGVNVMCSPQTTISLSRAHMLAPDGRCKTFDASADGFARGEGCGVLVLKRLSDAQADGDRILAVIRGTAVNQDGRSGGLTVPNGPAQEAVIRAALADAGLAGTDIDYVEAHGTGTSLGDPIEVRALAGALGPGRGPDDPLVIGSVKTNFGHLESAAGVAGVMKVVLALQHERIPAHLHFREPSPRIAWADYPVRVLPEGRAWARGARVRRAGVSSFGFSGTNAHVVLEEAPAAVAATTAALPRPLHCLPLSARTPTALRELARRMAGVLVPGGPALGDVAHTLATGRAHLPERLAVVAAEAATAREALAAFADGRAHPALVSGSTEPGQEPEAVFLYTGQGAQYPGMGRGLYETLPAYREVIDRCDAILGPDAQGRTLRSVLADGPAEGAAIHETAWTQPALFAVECALTQAWRSWGIEPAALIGHSAGEYAAACVAGVFPLEAGLRLVAERGRLLQGLPPGGEMAAVFMPVEEAKRAIAPWAGRVAIAAHNAPDSVVLSGEEGALEEVLAALAKRDVQGRRLFVSFAAHSPLVEPAMDGMEACARAVPMQAPTIPVAWNVTGGQPLPGGAPDAAYWRRHLREPVRFAEGMATLHAQGHRVYLESGPHPTLVALAQRAVPEGEAAWLASLRRGQDDWSQMLGSLAALYVRGASIDWDAVDRPHGFARVPLPTYPFERRRFWIEASARRLAPSAPRAAGLIGSRLPTALPIFETRLAPASTPWMAQHRIAGAVLVAGPVFLELAQAAAAAADGPALRAIEAFSIRDPLVLPDEGRLVQTHLAEPDAQGRAFAIHSRAADGSGEWRLHATGRLANTSAAAAVSGANTTALSATRDALGAAAPGAGFYERLQALGIDIGPAFRALESAHRADGEALARLVLPDSCDSAAAAWAHPPLLDGALQAVGLALPPTSDPKQTYLLSGVDRLELAGPLPGVVLAHARVLNAQERDPAQWQAEVTLRSEQGAILGMLRGVKLRRASAEALARVAGGAAALEHYRFGWEPAPLAPPSAPHLVPPARTAPAVAARFGALAAEFGLSLYDELLPELDRLARDHVGAALRALGFDATPGRTFEAGAEAVRLGVAARHRRLFARMLAMLVEEGALAAEGAGLRVAGPLPGEDPLARYDALLARFAPHDGELRVLRRCAAELARVLRGEQDPLQLLFPGGSLAEARALYVDSPFARTYNRALLEALQAALAHRPEGTRLRILEIGAGTGGTTTYVLPALPAARTEYTFTDLSPLFLERAAEQFRAYPFVRYALLDAERDPVAQGFPAAGYDIVIAANVLHATADLGAALAHAHRLLAPGGQLLLLEGVAPERWVDLTFGLTEGWWRFTDTALRPDYPLVGRERWPALLAERGFEDAAVLPAAAGGRATTQQALVLARRGPGARRWLLVGDEAGVGAAFAALLAARGETARCVPAAALADAAQLADVDEVVYLGALELAPLGLDAPGAAPLAADLAVQHPLRWLQASLASPARTWLAIQGVEGARVPGAAWQAALQGLARGFALEHPERWGALVDLDRGDAPTAARALLEALDGADGEDQVMLRDGSRLAARLAIEPAPPAGAPALRAQATYLVTGGFGGLGRLVARWLVERGARHVALMGRHADPDSEAIRELQAMGARAYAVQADVGDEAALAAALATLRREAPPLAGVVHAAAALQSAPFAQLTPDAVRDMLRPKLAGSVALERLTRAPGVDFLVLFSSTTGLWGASGLAHYAAANAFVDGLARAADGPGRRVLSIAWGTWEAMRLASAEDRRRFSEGGLLPMPAADALEALGRLLAAPRPHAVVAHVDWATFKPLYETRRARPLLARLGAAAQDAPREGAQAASGPTLAERVAGVPQAMRHDLLVEYVQGEVAAVLGLEGAAGVPVATGLFDLGMDSLMSVELKRRLERGAGRALPSTLTFNYPNVGALARFLGTQLAPAASAVPEASATAAPAAPPVAAPHAESDLDELSDEELEARLLARLDQVK